MISKTIMASSKAKSILLNVRGMLQRFSCKWPLIALFEVLYPDSHDFLQFILIIWYWLHFVCVLGFIFRLFFPVSNLNIFPKCVDINLTVFCDFNVFISHLLPLVFQLLCKLCFLPIPLFESLNQRPVNHFYNKLFEKLLSPRNFEIHLVGLMMNISDFLDSLGFQSLILFSLNLVFEVNSLESFEFILFKSLSWELETLRGKIHSFRWFVWLKISFQSVKPLRSCWVIFFMWVSMETAKLIYGNPATNKSPFGTDFKGWLIALIERGFVKRVISAIKCYLCPLLSFIVLYKSQLWIDWYLSKCMRWPLWLLSQY